MDQTLRGKLKWQFILFLARRLPDCKTITPTFSASIDRRLTFKEKIVTKLHLFTCEACVLYLEQIRFIHNFLHDHSPVLDQNNTSLNDAAKERMKAMLSSTN